MMALVRAGATLMLLLVFLGIVAWAYSSRRKQDFDAMARLALDVEEPAAEAAPAKERSRE